MTSGIDGALIRDVLVGIGVLLAGVGVFLACRGLAGLFTRLNATLDEVDRQIEAVSGPVVDTLKHVGGIANTADTTVAHLSGVVGKLEGIAGAASRTAKLASDAVAPALVNVGSTLTGITAGVQRLFGKRRGRSDTGEMTPDVR